MKTDQIPFQTDTRQAVAAVLLNEPGSSPIILVCEHASNHIPPAFNDLGLSRSTLESHIAWDPGALDVTMKMGNLLDAKIVTTSVSRLVYDCNRPPETADAIPEKSESYEIPGNQGLNRTSRSERVTTYYAPFCKLLDQQMTTQPRPLALVTIHSFEPIYFDRPRDVEIGIIHDTDSRLADEMIDIMAADQKFQTCRNDPYGPEDGVTHTLKTHGISNGVLNVMIEIRNDLVRTGTGQTEIADHLASILRQALEHLGVPLVAGVSNAASH